MLALGTAGTAVYLLRTNRELLRAQVAKTGAEGESSNVATAVQLIQELRTERKDLRERLKEAEAKEATTRAEREALWKERQDLQEEIEFRDRHIRRLREILREAGVAEPQDPVAMAKPPPSE